MGECPNLCFENNPDVIADMMNGCSGIELSDCIGALVGLGRIAARMQASISNLQKDNVSFEKAVKYLMTFKDDSMEVFEDIAGNVDKHEIHLAMLSWHTKLNKDEKTGKVVGMDHKLTCDQLEKIVETVTEKTKSENFKDTELTYKMNSMKNRMEQMIENHGGDKSKVNIVTVIW